MSANDLIVAHQIYSEWHRDDPKHDLDVAYSMLLLSIKPTVSKLELQERKTRLAEISQRQTEELRHVESVLKTAGVEQADLDAWVVLLTRRVTCATVEAALDLLAES